MQILHCSSNVLSFHLTLSPLTLSPTISSPLHIPKLYYIHYTHSVLLVLYQHIKEISFAPDLLAFICYKESQPSSAPLSLITTLRELPKIHFTYPSYLVDILASYHQNASFLYEWHRPGRRILRL